MTIKLLTILIWTFYSTSLFSQQLYLEILGAANRTAYNQQRYTTADDYYSYGGRLAAGADHFQLGVEYQTNYTNPVFSTSLVSEEFKDTYYGAFLRTNISRFPAMRFGLVLRAGAGMYTSDWITKVPPGSPVSLTESYSAHLGFNAGAGFSIPLFRATMLQMGYTYYRINRPQLDAAGIPEFQANIHAIQAGLSLNFVFGKRAERYREIRQQRLDIRNR